MLIIARRMGPDGESVIVNDRWTIRVTGFEIVTNRPGLRLRALEHSTPYRFTIRIHDAQAGTEQDVKLFTRHPDDVDDEANVLVLKNHGHKLTVFIVRLRGEVVRLGFEGKEQMFDVRRAETPKE